MGVTSSEPLKGPQEIATSSKGEERILKMVLNMRFKRRIPQIIILFEDLLQTMILSVHVEFVRLRKHQDFCLF